MHKDLEQGCPAKLLFVLLCLGGECLTIFKLHFLHEASPSGPLISRLNRLGFGLCFDDIFDSAVSC